MRVKIYEDMQGSKILLVRDDFVFADLPTDRLATIRPQLKYPYSVKESQLYSMGVNVGVAIPALISNGYCFL